ncbi:MAG: tRNA uridine-5-carboxymethylaminomethyl(34) synthesis GTPase MnmE [Oscillospiraceae bacterium]|jgi:tRNA modification GTPase
MSDVIAAISTPAGVGAIGILRLSGQNCLAVAERVFRPKNGKPFSENPPRTMVYGDLRDAGGAVIDHIVAFYSPAPRSYTGEDCVELHCHGSPVVLASGLEALCRSGARPAEAGEFTRRAFLNGKLDLTGAEAVIDLIEAQSPEAARNAAGQLGGELYRLISGVYDELLSLAGQFFAAVDYPEEDIEPPRAAAMQKTLDSAAGKLKRLLETYNRGRFLRSGVPVCILGSPNTGKSTLLNALLGYERAIVTEIPGTTRDTITESVYMGGVLLRLIDTAGIRETGDRVEALGIERSREAARSSELAILVSEGSRALSGADFEAMEAANAAPRRIALVNKTDLPEDPSVFKTLSERFETVLRISARDGTGIDALEEEIRRLFSSDCPADGSILTNLRQKTAAEAALEAIASARDALRNGLTPDAVLSDIESAMAALGEITGRRVTEDIVNDIFSRFCVGK